MARWSAEVVGWFACIAAGPIRYPRARSTLCEAESAGETLPALDLQHRRHLLLMPQQNIHMMPGVGAGPIH